MFKRKIKLDPEEKKLLSSVERGEWSSAKLAPSERDRYIRFARNTLKKDMRVNIRISQLDLHGIQTKAVQEGIPYQTLIASILHKFVIGRLVSKG